MGYIIGIDDAGRGPLIGPMFLAGVLLDENDEKYLKEKGVADSKMLLHNKRIELSNIIREKALNIHIEKSDPIDIDKAVKTINLNTLEAKKAAEIINKLNNKKDKIRVIVDCPSVNLIAWKNTMVKFIEHPSNLEIYCEHKADANHISVSAASIMAKVERENSVKELKIKYGDFGSGYPSDPFTKNFLIKNGALLKDSGIFRKTWATWKAMFPDVSQSTLNLGSNSN